MTLAQQWRHLPRDSRDTLFLLGVIAWTVLPHIPHLPTWCTLLTAVMLIWRTQLAMTHGPLPGRVWLAVLLLVAVALTLWSYRTLLGKEPGVTMAVTLMALKTLELRARRDAFVVFFLGFFIVLTHFLYSQSLLVAAAMLVSVWGMLTALVLAHMPVGQPRLRQAATLALRTALLGAPIMALLFLLFPRVGPLWGVPQDSRASMGLSSHMQMGKLAELAQDDRIVLRVRFHDAVPPPQAMYFRGPVFTRFDGTEWRAQRPTSNAPAVQPELQTRGPSVRYEMTLEPQRLTVLPLLEANLAAPQLDEQTVAPREELLWVTERPSNERLRFEAAASIDFRLGLAPNSRALDDAVQLPARYNPRTLAWARALRREPRLAAAGPRGLAQAVMARIHDGEYTYTLAPGVYGETDPFGAIDEFWLDHKMGFCEHFAASFVVIMRAMGVPARVVTGYQGTDPLPVDGYYIVRNSHAHAWAEYWDPAAGWVRADPTAAVSPERIVRSRHLTPAPGLMAGALSSFSPQLLAQLGTAWEALNNRWNQWVLSYSRGHQLDLLRTLGVRAPSWQDLSLALILALSGLALAGAGWAWWDRRRVDPWVRQMNSVRRALGALGIDAAGHEAPRTLALRVRARLGSSGERLTELLHTLELQRYGREAARRPDARLTRHVRRTVRALRREGRAAPML
jgi:transglutaminase-like putative cysteine protease